MNELIALVSSMLDDDNGVSSSTYERLCELADATKDEDTKSALYRLIGKVKATDGRFYLPYNEVY